MQRTNLFIFSINVLQKLYPGPQFANRIQRGILYATWNHAAPRTIHEIIEEFYYDNNTTIRITKDILLHDSI